jgi:hypothetical protein
VEPIVSPLLGTLKVEAQLDKDATPSKLSEETSLGIDTLREEVPIKIDREVKLNTPVTMAQEGGGMDPPPNQCHPYHLLTHWLDREVYQFWSHKT